MTRVAYIRMAMDSLPSSVRRTRQGVQAKGPNTTMRNRAFLSDLNNKKQVTLLGDRYRQCQEWRWPLGQPPFYTFATNYVPISG